LVPLLRQQQQGVYRPVLPGLLLPGLQGVSVLDVLAGD
jgi:hypothetical protein